MGQIDTEGRQIWLRAFYGFNPEEAGYLGFTHEKTREGMLEKMRDGDLVLIYGAVDDLTQTDQKAQALGFLEVTNEPCMDWEMQNEESIAWKKEHGFEERWTFGIKVRRAWRINNRVHIRTIAPEAYQPEYRFERTTRAILLSADECSRALSHPVHQVNVYGEPPIADELLAKGIMERVLKPSQGIPPSFGRRSHEHEDGENFLYFMALSENAEVLLGKTGSHLGKALVKVGRSNDPKRRLKEINSGFPEVAFCRWKLLLIQPFENAKIAHDLEDKLKQQFAEAFASQGGEFYTGELSSMKRNFINFCTSHMPVIMAAPGKAKG